VKPEPGPEILLKYFPELKNDTLKYRKFEQLFELYKDWNSKVNVISRKDFPNFYLHHVLHSLSIAKFFSFTNEHTILDAGTGGGFPGIPLAIFFPESTFCLVDSIGKKIKIVQNIADNLELNNVHPIQERIENLKGYSFDFIISRALASVSQILTWTKGLLKPEHPEFQRGYIFLKGGNLNEEIKPFRQKFHIEITPLSLIFHEFFFNDKKIVFFLQK